MTQFIFLLHIVIGPLFCRSFHESWHKEYYVLIFNMVLIHEDESSTINPSAVLINVSVMEKRIVSYLYLHLVETSGLEKTRIILAICSIKHALSYSIQPMCCCVCCAYTMRQCAGSLRGSNGCEIRLWTMSVSFQPTTDVDMSRKIISPFQPLGLKPLSSYCLMKYTPWKGSHIFYQGETAVQEKWNGTFPFLGKRCLQKLRPHCAVCNSAWSIFSCNSCLWTKKHQLGHNI